MTITDAVERFVLFPSTWNQNAYYKKIGKRWYAYKIISDKSDYRSVVIGNALGLYTGGTTRGYRSVDTYKPLLSCYRDGCIIEDKDLQYTLPRRNYRELKTLLLKYATIVSEDETRKFWRMNRLSTTPMLDSGDFWQFINAYSESEV